MREFDEAAMHEIAAGLFLLNKRWNLTMATCAEQINLSKYDIGHACCIDGELMVKLFPADHILMNYLGLNSVGNLFAAFPHPANINANLKDNGQRAQCGCITSKDIGQYNTCLHLCTYCYANFSENVVRKNMSTFKPMP